MCIRDSIQILNTSSASSILIGKNPSASLDNLQLRYGGGASRFSTADALDLINHGNGHFNYFLSGSGSGSFVWHKGSSNELMSLTNGGNLGLGITNPTQKLHVQGNTFITGIATATTFKGAFNGVFTGNLQGNIDGPVNDVGFSTFSELRASSGVGIGVTSSGQRFSVNGNINQRVVIKNTGQVGIMTDTPQDNASLTTRKDIICFGALGVGNTARCYADFHDAVNAPAFADGGRSAANIEKLAYMMPPQVDTSQRDSLVDGYDFTGNTAVPNGAVVFVTDLNNGTLQVRRNGQWVSLHN